MRKCFIIITVIFLILIAQISFSAECATGSRIFTEIGLETRYMSGDSIYHISFDEPWDYGGHGESELEFPFNNFMLGVNLGVGTKDAIYPEHTRGFFSLSFFYAPPMDSGTMKDSDWIENDEAFGELMHPGKDLYSESDTESTGFMFDVSYAYHFRMCKNWMLGPLAGLRYQKFQFDIDGCNGMYWTTPVCLKGKVLDYEIQYAIPFIGLSSNLYLGKDDKFQMNLSFTYSPWTDISDRDDHILRNKLSESGCHGDTYMVKAKLSWNFHSNWIVNLGAEYVNIDTSGTQTQSWYDDTYIVPLYTVDDEIQASYWSAFASISYEFY